MANNKIQLADGTVLLDLTTDSVDASHLAQGYTAHDCSGAAIVGTMSGGKPEQSKSATPTETAQTILPDDGYTLSSVDVGAISSTYVGSQVPRKTSSDLTVSGATVSVPSGYYENAAEKSVATVEQATPSVSINTSTGVVTATATQTEGYVSAGSKSGTLSLTKQAAKTVTPSASVQTAVAANRYTTGQVKVAAVPTETPSTITANGTYSSTSGKWWTGVTVNVPTVQAAQGTFYLSSTTQSLTISHNLGVVPTRLVLASKSTENAASWTVVSSFYWGGVGQTISFNAINVLNDYDSVFENRTSTSFTLNTILAGSSVKLAKNRSYFWTVFA